MKKEENAWDNLWFLSRVVVGWLLHAALIVVALFNIEVMFEATRGFYSNHADAPMFSPFIVGIFMAVSFFTASMAGVYWVKQLYIRYALPEVMDEMTKKLMK